MRSLYITHTHTDTDTRLSPIHPAYRSLAAPIRMFGWISRIRKLFDPASWFLAIKGFYKVEAIGVANATYATTSRNKGSLAYRQRSP